MQLLEDSIGNWGELEWYSWKSCVTTKDHCLNQSDQVLCTGWQLPKCKWFEWCQTLDSVYCPQKVKKSTQYWAFCLGALGRHKGCSLSAAWIREDSDDTLQFWVVQPYFLLWSVYHLPRVSTEQTLGTFSACADCVQFLSPCCKGLLVTGALELQACKLVSCTTQSHSISHVALVLCYSAVVVSHLLMEVERGVYLSSFQTF